jgi:hypothetical protein
MFGTPPARHAARTGVVGGQGQFGRAEAVELLLEVVRPAVDVLRRVGRVHAQPAGGLRHELHHAHGPCGRDSARIAAAFGRGDAVEQRRVEPVLLRRELISP